MNKSNLMKQAWNLAREGAAKFGGKVREYFAAALRMAWEATRKPVNVVAALLAIGGKEWIKEGMHRIYFNNLAQFIGFEYETYKTGMVKIASLAGKSISNNQANGLVTTLKVGRVFFDVSTGTFQRNNYISTDVFGLVVDGINKAAGI